MRILLIFILFVLPSLSLANTEEELRNIETLNRWGDIWINKQYELIEELVKPVYIRHEPSGTVHVAYYRNYEH